MAYSVKFLGKPHQLTYLEVVGALALGGWPEKHWEKATAVIAAESNRMINIYNTYKQGHYGLMQISKSAHPGFFKGLKKPGDWVNPAINVKYGYTLYRQSGFQPWEAYTNGRYMGNRLQAVQAVAKMKQLRRAHGVAGGSATSVYSSVFRKSTLEAIADISGRTADELAGGLDSLGDSIEAGGEAAGTGMAAVGAGVLQSAGALSGSLQMLLGAGRWLTQPQNWVRVGQVVTGGALVIGGIGVIARGGAAGVPLPPGMKQLARVAKRAGKGK